MGFLGGLIGKIGAVATGFARGGPIGAATGLAGALGASGSSRQKRQRQQEVRSPFNQFSRPGGVIETTRAIQTQAAQAIPQLPQIGGFGARTGISINPPFGGDPGIGIAFGASAGRTGRSGTVMTQSVPASRRQAVPMIGSFAVDPTVETRQVRVCPSGMRLAIDGLCYPKALLGKRSKLRAWPADPAPAISAADRRALRKIGSVKRKVRDLGKDAGLKVTSR